MAVPLLENFRRNGKMVKRKKIPKNSIVLKRHPIWKKLRAS